MYIPRNLRPPGTFARHLRLASLWGLRPTKLARLGAFGHKVAAALLSPQAASGGSAEPAPPECYKIVFTGGPCAGKTTALARVSNFLRSRGFTVYSVPEAATLIFQNGGAFFDQGAEEDVIVFQTKLIKLQII